MTAAASFDPLILRIEEVLALGAGTLRTLAESDRFALRSFPGQDAAVRARIARQRKTAWVWIPDAEPHPSHKEPVNVATYVVAVRLDLSYFAGSTVDHEQMREAVQLSTTDLHLVRAALCWPGNLSETLDGDPTGLADGALDFLSWRSEGLDAEAREIRTTMLFRGIAQVTNPS